MKNAHIDAQALFAPALAVAPAFVGLRHRHVHSWAPMADAAFGSTATAAAPAQAERPATPVPRTPLTS